MDALIEKTKEIVRPNRKVPIMHRAIKDFTLITNPFSLIKRHCSKTSKTTYNIDL